MDIQLAVSRYNEDVSWLQDVTARNDRIDTYVYNKGSYLTVPNTAEYRYVVIQALSNIGREGQTYIHHILQHYDEIDDMSELRNDYYAFLQGNPFDHVHREDLLQRLSSEHNAPIIGLTHHVFQDDGTAQHHHKRLPIHAYYERITGKPRKSHYDFFVGCQFMVTPDVIVSKPYAWWLTIYRLFETEPDMPWIFERLIPSILLD